MTNLEGLWELYVLLSLFFICIGVTVVLLGAHRRTGRTSDGGSLSRWRTGTAVAGIVMSSASLIVLGVIVTPSGIVEHLGDINLVLVALLCGYSAPAVGGGCLLWNRHNPRSTGANSAP